MTHGDRFRESLEPNQLSRFAAAELLLWYIMGICSLCEKHMYTPKNYRLKQF
jgi:hypothetical protein